MHIFDASYAQVTGRSQVVNPDAVDGVVVSVILGFVAARFAMADPVVFSHDKGPNDEAHAAVQRALTLALRSAGHSPGVGGGIQIASIKGKYRPGSLSSQELAITGRSGGASALDRQRQIGGEALDLARSLASASQKTGKEALDPSIDNEIGAYYGIVDDPLTNQVTLASTTRRQIPYQGPEGKRWRPRGTVDDHGLIPGTDATMGGESWASLNQASGRAKGSAKVSRSGCVVGYCHGMTSAILQAKLIGPWCTPYEVAVGSKTTKLASCFGCTTFMYATGYPPSHIHLGQSASWVPLPPDLTGFNVDFQGPESEQVRESLNLMFYREVAAYLDMGSEILGRASNAKDKQLGRTINAFVRKVRSSRKSQAMGSRDVANIYLDALAVNHQSDYKRVLKLLKAT